MYGRAKCDLRAVNHKKSTMKHQGEYNLGDADAMRCEKRREEKRREEICHVEFV
jgi:hypothetical protein